MSNQSEIDRIKQNVANTYAVLEALGADIPAEQNSNNLAATAGSAKVVLYKEQTLTDAQKAQARENIGAVADEDTAVHNAVGTTFPPAQRSAEATFDDYDIDIHNATSDSIHAYIDDIVSGKETVTKEIMGKDASGKYDIARYIYAKREHLAWVKENYPKMYAWKNGSALRYTESVAPRIGDKAYDVPYIGGSGGTTTETVTVPPKAVIYKGYRYSHSSAAFKADSTVASVILPLPVEGVTTAVVNFSGPITGSTYSVYGSTTNTAFPNQTGSASPWSNSGKTCTVPNGNFTLSGLKFLAITITSTGVAGEYDGGTITLNGEVIPWVEGQPSEATQASTTTTEVETDGGGVPITAVSATNRSRTIGDLAYVRSEVDDVEPTVIYTDKDDDRNSGATITEDGVTYKRYPLGDLGANRTKLTPIVIWANVHGTKNPIPAEVVSGVTVETKMCALVAARFMRDLAADKQSKNPLYKYIRENCMVIVIPVANPFGYNLNVSGDAPGYSWAADGYYNYNGCNINRNHDTPGWDVMRNNGSESATTMGTYPCSQNETQYLDNTMVESGAVVAMSFHGGDRTDLYCLHQGQNPDPSGTGYVDYDQDKLALVGAFLNENWGYTLRYYDMANGEPVRVNNTPDKTSKDPSFISQCGAYGGILEFPVADPDIGAYTRVINGKVVEHAYAQMLNLMAMWLSDYLEG